MQNVHSGFVIYSLICFTLRLFSLATVLASVTFCCRTAVKMSAAAWKSPGKSGQAWQVHGPSWGTLGTEGTQRVGEVMVALRTEETQFGGV